MGDNSEGVGEGRAAGKKVHVTTKERFGARKAASLSEVEGVVVGGDESEGVGGWPFTKVGECGGTEVHALVSEKEEVSVGGRRVGWEEVPRRQIPLLEKVIYPPQIVGRAGMMMMIATSNLVIVINEMITRVMKREILNPIFRQRWRRRRRSYKELQGVTRKKQTATDLLVLTRLFGT